MSSKLADPIINHVGSKVLPPCSVGLSGESFWLYKEKKLAKLRAVQQ
jgi:hypothetical protein